MGAWGLWLGKPTKEQKLIKTIAKVKNISVEDAARRYEKGFGDLDKKMEEKK